MGRKVLNSRLDEGVAVVIESGFLTQDELDALSVAAFTDPVLDDQGGAIASSAMYSYFRSRPGAIGLVAREGGEVAGFSYGYPNFQWADHTSDWDDHLRASLRDPEEIVGAFVVMCLMVHPDHQGLGIGTILLEDLVSPHETAWLATRDAATAAQGLYAKAGWIEIGRGPLAGPGETSVVLLHESGVKHLPQDRVGA
jgi:GNAT superfamily N-acetyltransferase